MGGRQPQAARAVEVHERNAPPSLQVADAKAVRLDEAFREGTRQARLRQISRMRGRTFLPNSSSERMSGAMSREAGGWSERAITPAPATSLQRRTCSTTVCAPPTNAVGRAPIVIC